MSASSAAIAAVRNCAMAMLQNASFIRHELPHVNMTDVHRTEAEAVCDAFIGTKHDAFSELGQLSDALVARRANQGEVIRRLDRINAWMRDDLNAMHHLVQGLHDALDEKKRNSNAYILVSESAVNVLNAFRAAHDAINALRQTARRARPPTLVIATSYEVECAEAIDGAPKVRQVAQFVRQADAADYADSAKAGAQYAVTEVLRHNVVAKCWGCRVPLTHEMTILFGQFQDDPIAFCKCPKCGTKYGYEVRLDESEKAIARYQARKPWRTAIPEGPRPRLPGLENYRLGPRYWFGGRIPPIPSPQKAADWCSVLPMMLTFARSGTREPHACTPCDLMTRSTQPNMPNPRGRGCLRLLSHLSRRFGMTNRRCVTTVMSRWFTL